MRRAVIGVALVAIVVLAGLFFLGFTPAEDIGSYMEITFYDEDGNELGKISNQFAIFGIQREGIEGDVYSLKPVVYFKVTTDIDYIALYTWCWLEIVTRVRSPTAGIVYTFPEASLGPANTDEEGSFYRSTRDGHFLMSELLPTNMITEPQKEWGWNMQFNARLKTTARRQDGTDKSIEANVPSTTLILNWVETLGVEGWFGNI